jgi:glycosyltransferase involved in cell wall biosynthesis
MFGPPVPANLAALLEAGSRVVGTLCHYRRPVLPRRPAATGDLRLRGGDRLALSARGEDFDEIWEEARRWHAVAGARDGAFVRWRYLAAPQPVAVHVLRRDGRPRGFLATAVLGRRLVVLDLLAASPSDVGPLAGAAVALASASGCREVATRLNPRTAYGRALERRGFLRGRDRPRFQVLSRAPLPALFRARGWHLTYGDEDVDDVASFLRGGGQPAAPRKPPRKRRRVAFLIDLYEGTHAGTEGQIETVLSRLPRGVEGRLLVLRRSRWLRRNRFPVRARSLDVPGLLRLRTLLRLPALAGLLRSERIDVLQAFQQDASVLGPVLGALAGVPVVVSRRDLGFWHSARSRAATSRAGRLAARFAANCDAVAHRVASDEHVPPGLIDVVRNGHDPARFEARAEPGLRERLRVPAGAPVVALVGNLKPLKRQADLVDALAALGPSARGAHALFVGHGDPRPLLDRAARLRLSGRVHVVAAPEGAVALLRHAAVGVLCSETEGLSNAGIECLGCGLPLVATDVGGNPELVEDGVNGFLYPVGDVAALARALGRLLADPSLAAAMGRAGRERFEARFRADRAVAETLGSVERALAARRRHPGALRVGVERDDRGVALLARDASGAVLGRLALVRAPHGVLEGGDASLVAAPEAALPVARAGLAALPSLRWRRVRLLGLAHDGALRLALRERRWTALPYGERPAGAGRFDVEVFRPTLAGRLSCLARGARALVR